VSSIFDNLTLGFWIQGINLFLQGDGSLNGCHHAAVGFDLLVVQVFLRPLLGLDVADDSVLAVPHPKIRVAGLGLLGEGGDVKLASAGGCSELLQERFQTGVEAFLLLARSPCPPGPAPGGQSQEASAGKGQ
jgi:hypothetical protein